MLEHTIILQPHQLSAFASMVNAAEKYYETEAWKQASDHISIYENIDNIHHAETAIELNNKLAKVFIKYRNKTMRKVRLKLNKSDIHLVLGGMLPANNNEYNVRVRQEIFNECLNAVENHLLNYR
jgi:hypothetical protein